MTKYTIAERQELKCKLADVKYFEQDLRLFAKLYPHHVINDECKRANKMNKAGLHSRMLYVLLTRATEEQIMTNRGHATKKDQSGSMNTGKIKTKVNGWMQSLRRLISRPQS